MNFLQKKKFDQSDFEIVNALSQNAKLSFNELGKIVNMSSPSAYQRTKKLEENGVILDYCAVVDYSKFGYAVHAFMLLKDDKFQYNEADQEVADVLYDMDEVFNCWTVAGEYDYLIEVYVENNDDLCNFIDKLYNITGRTYTIMLIRNHKYFKREPISGDNDI